MTHHCETLIEDDLVVVEGVRCTGVARTLAELGSVVNPQQVWRALIEARRRNVSPIWLRQTALRVHRPGQSGSGVLLRALDRWSTEGRLPESWFEALLEELLNDPSIPEVPRQYTIRNAAGRFVARVDLAIPSVRLGLEAHSRQFHFGPIHELRDEDRDLRAAAAGWELLYLGWYATQSPAQVRQLVAEVVQQRRRSRQV